MTRSASHSILPPLTPEEQRQSAAVSELIRGQIEAAGGVVSFESFMEAALYAPGLGYYSAGATKIGAGGISSRHRRFPICSAAALPGNAHRC